MTAALKTDSPALRGYSVLLQMLDLLTTLAAFHRGGFEANPVTAILLPAISPAMGLILVKSAVAFASFRLTRRPLQFLAAVYTAVVLWNVFVLSLL